MNRIFGSTSKTPKPNLNDSISSNDTRIDAIEVKLRKLDAELTKYRDQLKRLRDGAGKVCYLTLSIRPMLSVPYRQQCRNELWQC